MQIVLIIIAMLIVAGLSMYATILLLRLKKQTAANKAALQAQQQALEQKRQELLGDIRYIAAAMTEDRCEISEGVYRIAKLFELLSLTERVSGEFPAFYEHFEVIKSHPIRDARTQLQKQERMRLDLQRMKSESALQENILLEAKRMTQFEPVTH
ncbi:MULTISPECIES: DUF2489 domain-containing protein [Shewanella]|uniref:DUF2489 domain-containing protein n=1 Tax=Shewanella TaxID=22 RepID=UPI0016757488|nr:DUF2489 domain-containing protein [Shewanella fodinae]MCL2908156.1 DUF2489 domain-containing protein [Shewanella fodinae]GGZ13743.1 hypothetical protein GCM10007169_32880 [Shewanella fodinae]